ENDNTERLKRLITLMEDLDFVTRLERSGQTADAAEPFRKPYSAAARLPGFSGPRPSWAEGSSPGRTDPHQSSKPWRFGSTRAVNRLPDQPRAGDMPRSLRATVSPQPGPQTRF